MPIVDGSYVAPTWANGTTPAITAAELQAMSDTIVNNQTGVGNAQSKIRVASVTLGTNWTTSGSNFTQTVTISGTTANSKIDVQPNALALSQMVSDKVSALYIDNNAGTLTAYAIGAKPTASLTVQVTITEVSAT